jgi:hypothetical protein
LNGKPFAALVILDHIQVLMLFRDFLRKHARLLTVAETSAARPVPVAPLLEQAL